MNPYTRLKNELRTWCSAVVCPKRRTMWLYPKNRLHEGWPLKDLWERTMAAQQIGYEVLLTAGDDGLTVTYVEKRPTDLPYGIRY